MNLCVRKKVQQIKTTWTRIFLHSLLLDISEKQLLITCVIKLLFTQYQNYTLSIATNPQQRFSPLISERKNSFPLEKCLFGLLLLKYCNFPAKIFFNKFGYTLSLFDETYVFMISFLCIYFIRNAWKQQWPIHNIYINVTHEIGFQESHTRPHRNRSMTCSWSTW